jgi:hypothetical protein
VLLIIRCGHRATELCADADSPFDLFDRSHARSVRAPEVIFVADVPGFREKSIGGDWDILISWPTVYLQAIMVTEIYIRQPVFVNYDVGMG